MPNGKIDVGIIGAFEHETPLHVDMRVVIDTLDVSMTLINPSADKFIVFDMKMVPDEALLMYIVVSFSMAASSKYGAVILLSVSCVDVESTSTTDVVEYNDDITAL
jgi:hypothetical protein